MKKTHILLTLLAAALVTGMLFVSCDTPTSTSVGKRDISNPTSVSYGGRDDVYSYNLTINKSPERSALSPMNGDLYVLVVLQLRTYTEFGRSAGKVTLTDGGFKLSNGGVELTVTINNKGILSITGGAIKTSGGDVTPAGTMTPMSPPPIGDSGIGGRLSGTYVEDTGLAGMGEAQITFSGSNFTMTINALGGAVTITASGIYTVSGNIITCIIISTTVNPAELSALSPIKPGDFETFTIVNENQISDEDGETIWTKK